MDTKDSVEMVGSHSELVSRLWREDKNFIKRVIDALITKSKLKELAL